MANDLRAEGQEEPRYKSLAALRTAHGELLQRRRDQEESPELGASMRALIEEGRQAGWMIDADQDRRAAQSLLDYWANILLRLGEEPPDATLAEFRPELAPALDDDLCPYRGLDPFQVADHDLYFGRQGMVQRLLQHLRAQRLALVVGPSGSGKSSLVLAGLIPALQGDALPASEAWAYLPPIVPGSNPLDNLAGVMETLEDGSSRGRQELVEQLRLDPSTLARFLARQQAAPAVLVVDQFEEVFTLGAGRRDCQAFVANLLQAVDEPKAGHRVILTMRTDFVFQLPRLPALQERLEEIQVVVTPLNAGELQQVIQGPADLVGLRFEDGIVDQLVQEVLGQPAALPLLQFTLLKLWENRERNRITWEAYRRVGGPLAALARSADQLYESLIPEDRETFKRIMLRLVQPSAGVETTSRRIPRNTLYLAGEATDRVDRVLDRLATARLVRITRREQQADIQVQVAHEALVRNWPRLTGWLDAERERLRRRLQVTEAAEQWLARGKDDDLLWRGALLEEALGYEDLNQLEQDFIQAARDDQLRTEQAREAARRRELEQAQALAIAEQERATLQGLTARRLRRLATALVILLALALVAVALAVMQRQEALAQQRDAQQKLQVAQDSLGAQIAFLEQLQQAEAEKALLEQQLALLRETTTPVPGITQVATPAPEPGCTVVAGPLRLRSGPGTGFSSMDSLGQGNELLPLARDATGAWILVQVSSTGQKGWVAVAQRQLRCTLDLLSLPLGQVPPTLITATPTPTGTPGPLGPLVLASFQDKAQPDSGYAGASDVTISQSMPTSRLGKESSCLVDGDDPPGSGNDLVSLLGWDLRTIPSNSLVEAASITLDIVDGTLDFYSVYELKRAWLEEEANWREASGGLIWSQPGASGLQDRGTATLGGFQAPETGRLTFQLNAAGIALVQLWVSDPALNNGILIGNAQATDGFDFRCREWGVGSAPILKVTYRSGNAIAAADQVATATAISLDVQLSQARATQEALIAPVQQFAPFTATPRPTATATRLAPTRTVQTACAFAPMPQFAAFWESNRSTLGCALDGGTTVTPACEEAFQGGHLFWRSDTAQVIIVFDRNLATGEDLLRGDWFTGPREWGWDGSDPNGIGLNPPPGFFEPVGGLGWLWRQFLGREGGRLGWATGKETCFDNQALAQVFQNGIIYRSRDPKTYGLLKDGPFVAAR